MKNIQISPSILSADFSQLGTEIKRLEEGGADMIHVDVMDGHFVPNLTIGPPVIKALRKHCSLKFDVHLMISPVHKYIDAYADAGADIITIHPEATNNLENSIKKIKEKNKKVGVSLNPESKIDLILDLLDQIDLVLIMSVNPGFGGQKFMPEVLDKIKELKKIKEQKKIAFDIEIDGGEAKMSENKASSNHIRKKKENGKKNLTTTELNHYLAALHGELEEDTWDMYLDWHLAFSLSDVAPVFASLYLDNIPVVARSESFFVEISILQSCSSHEF
mgnify:CR=1 FL=1